MEPLHKLDIVPGEDFEMWIWMIDDACLLNVHDEDKCKVVLNYRGKLSN